MRRRQDIRRYQPDITPCNPPVHQREKALLEALANGWCLYGRRHSGSRIHSMRPVFWSRRREKVIRILPNIGSTGRLVGALCAETHEEWSTGHRDLNMDAYFEWRTDRSDEEALAEKASPGGEPAAQPATVPA